MYQNRLWADFMYWACISMGTLALYIMYMMYNYGAMVFPYLRMFLAWIMLWNTSVISLGRNSRAPCISELCFGMEIRGSEGATLVHGLPSPAKEHPMHQNSISHFTKGPGRLLYLGGCCTRYYHWWVHYEYETHQRLHNEDEDIKVRPILIPDCIVTNHHRVARLWDGSM